MSANDNFAGISFGYDADKIFKERDETMCNRWTCNKSHYADCNIDVYSNPLGNFIIKGRTNNGSAQAVKYWASAPPTYSLSYAGSGVPYPNEFTAYENTPNKGVAKVVNGEFEFALQYPNSYYEQMGKKYITPHVHMVFSDQNSKNVSNVKYLPLGNGIPFRDLTWPRKRNWNIGPLFYCNNNLPVRNQEQILRDSGYPCVNEEPANFWGLKPPR